MIVKRPISWLKPGMYVANPGLSELSNPQVYLVEGLVDGPEAVKSIARRFASVYIDTEKGDYFVTHRSEKADYEAIYHPLSVLEDEAGVIGGGLDEVLANFKAADSKYTELIEQYKLIVSAMGATKDVDMGACTELVDSLARTEDHLLLPLLLVSRMRVFDSYSYTHSLNVSLLAVLAARNFGFSKNAQTLFGMAGIFHDVGKILISDKILKKNSRLSTAEFAEIKRHPVYGRDLLSKHKDVPAEVVHCAFEHHEHYNGGGYPLGLSGEAINKTAALISIIDTYDALRSDRYYREAVSGHKAICVIYGLKGKAYDPVLVDKIIKMVGIYPMGSIVMLRSGEKGIVTRQNPQNLLRPHIRVILGADNRYCDPRDVDLMGENPEGPYAIVDTLTNKECRVHIMALVK